MAEVTQNAKSLWMETVAMKLKDTCSLEGASQVVLVVKNPPANTGDIRDMGFIPGLGNSPGGGHSNQLLVFLPGESHMQPIP